MHRHPWRIVRALRVLIACLMLMLPAAPSHAAPARADTVLVVACATAAAREASRTDSEAPAPSIEIVFAAGAVIAAATESRPAAATLVPIADRWLVHCPLLC
jgi:hypothetical protein